MARKSLKRVPTRHTSGLDIRGLGALERSASRNRPLGDDSFCSARSATQRSPTSRRCAVRGPSGLR